MGKGKGSTQSSIARQALALLADWPGGHGDQCGAMRAYARGVLGRLETVSTAIGAAGKGQTAAPTVKAAPRGRQGAYGAFCKAADDAGYVLCRTCNAYRFPDHVEGAGDCDPGYLYRPMVVGNYQARPVVVELVGGLEPDDEDTGPSIPDPICEQVAA